MSKATSHISKRRGKLLESGAAEYTARREELICIAAEVFKKKGYHSAKLSDISQAAGIDRASLYYYISGKEELFHDIIYKATISNVAMIEAIAESDNDAVGKLRELICKILIAFREQYPHMFVYLQEDMQTIKQSNDGWGKEMHELASRYDKVLIKIVQQGLDEGSIRPVSDARLIAFGITGMTHWSYRWYRPDKGYSAEKIGNDFADMVLLGLVKS